MTLQRQLPQLVAENSLITQAPNAEIRPLRQEEDLAIQRSFHHAIPHRPKLSDDPRNRRLADAASRQYL